MYPGEQHCGEFACHRITHQTEKPACHLRSTVQLSCIIQRSRIQHCTLHFSLSTTLRQRLHTAAGSPSTSLLLLLPGAPCAGVARARRTVADPARLPVAAAAPAAAAVLLLLLLLLLLTLLLLALRKGKWRISLGYDEELVVLT